MKLTVEVFTGPLFHLEVKDDATVGELKKEIAKQENLPREKMLLAQVTRDQQVMANDAARLTDYGVRDGSLICIYFSLPPLSFLSASHAKQDDGSTSSSGGNAAGKQKVPRSWYSAYIYAPQILKIP